MLDLPLVVHCKLSKENSRKFTIVAGVFLFITVDTGQHQEHKSQLGKSGEGEGKQRQQGKKLQ